MKKIVVLNLLALFLAAGQLHAGMDEGMKGKEGPGMEMEEHVFPHPLLNHMGVPDMPGMVSVRFTAYRQGEDGEPSREDYGFHLEAGLFRNFGVHVRNNALQQSPRTDVMLMWRVLPYGEGGLSLFGGALIPSGTIPEGQSDIIGLFGVSGRLMIGDGAILDGQIHHMPEMEMFETGISVVLKATERLFPILEVEGEIREDETDFTVVPALKFKLAPERFIGVGAQIAVTSDRDFDTRTMVQFDMAWQNHECSWPGDASRRGLAGHIGRVQTRLTRAQLTFMPASQV